MNNAESEERAFPAEAQGQSPRGARVRAGNGPARRPMCGWGRGTMESAEEVREGTGQVLEVPQATENPV